ncbi:hypothetical protein KBB08_01990 [Candidatus Gracilibacteria bacterium]|nr:hypothetical protein [Candidatus Gracilibacteria bacterium]
MLVDELKHLGLTEPEVKVYLGLLALGGGVVSAIAKRAQVNRVTTYNTLANLVKKGYITYHERQHIRYYVAESPTLIVGKLEEKYHIAKKVMPELFALQNTASTAPQIRLYEEKESILSIFEDIAQARTEILGYTNFEPLEQLFPEVLGKFAYSISQKELKMRCLAPCDAANERCIQSYFQEVIAAGLVEIFTVNPRQFLFQNSVFFYDNKMAIISYDQNELLGVIIQSALNIQTQKAMFDLAWLGATSFTVR